MAPKKRTSDRRGGEPKAKTSKKVGEGLSAIAPESMALPHLKIYEEWAFL